MRDLFDPTSPSEKYSHGFTEVVVGGLKTVVATRSQLAEAMVRDCQAARAAQRKPAPRLVFSSNGQGISLVGTDREFAKTMGAADIIHADGMSVVKGSRWFGSTPIPERAATTDFFHDAAKAAVRSGLRFYVLGGKEEQNAAAVDSMLRLYPDLNIVGRRNGYFRSEEDSDVCRQVVESGADVLWVGLGKPKQEFWSVANRERLRGVGWVKTCGGLYSYLAGDAPRAPDWMQRAGLEWLFRSVLEPRRLGVRYLLTNPHSFYRMVRYSG
ncbi:WecB/TagA/CpsF family glycosyltransferase [Phenylobacterium sp. LjRoot219]|uniref:WecB/TagA/CpsF family glycosyltransferase n=1 Tax=Phenylobacterium sp. LjRoot219 TaxID=3342283 RepID=UPI003ECEDD0F